MLQSKIGRNYLICFVVLNVILIGPFVYAVLKRPDLVSAVLPGQFGISMTFSGNMLFLALLLLLNALLALIFGVGGTWHALWAGLRISPRKMRWLLHDRAGLASDISGVVAAAVQEEEKAEIAYIGRARGLLAAGLLLFAAALPALCITYTRAAPDGPAIFENAGQIIANDAVNQNMVLRFTADQLAGGLLLDIPEIFHLRATPVETNGANIPLGVLVLLYRTLIGFGVLLLVVGIRRANALRAFAMETPLPVAEIVALEPVFQDGHGGYVHAGHHHDIQEIPADAGHHHEDHAHHAQEEHRDYEPAETHHEHPSSDEALGDEECPVDAGEEPHHADYDHSDNRHAGHSGDEYGHDAHADRGDDRHGHAMAENLTVDEPHGAELENPRVADGVEDSTPAREFESG